MSEAWWHDAVVFVKHEGRYDFLNARGEVVQTMTPDEFESWKAKNPLNRSAGAGE
jgi:hypothetical protein